MCYKKILSRNIRLAKANDYNNKLSISQNDPRSTFIPSKKSQMLKINVNNRVLTDPNEMADTFNDYSTSVADQLDSTIPQVTADPLQFINRTPSTFVYFETDSQEVKKCILSFESKRSKFNEIPLLAFKFVADLISPMLAKLFNESVISGKFQFCFNNARAVLIHKSGGKSDVKNYRPISTLPFIG